MARRPPKYKQEARFRQEVKQGLDKLKDARRILREAERQTLRNKPPRFGKIPNADYRRMLQLEKKFGVYEPTDTDLTPARKRAIRQRWNELEYLFENSTFTPFPVGMPKPTKRKVARELRRAFPNEVTEEQFQPIRKQRVTKRGLFKPTGARQIGSIRQTQKTGDRTESVVVEPNVGTLKYDRETGTWAIEVRRKTKQGLYVKEINYIAGPEIEDAKFERLVRRFEKMPKPKRNQRLRFFMPGNPPNASGKVFRTMQELRNFLQHYRKDAQARASFMNEITIAVVQKGGGTKSDPWREVVSGFRGSNYHEIDPDDFMEEMEDDDE
jgi:hypothetical protein